MIELSWVTASLIFLIVVITYLLYSKVLMPYRQYITYRKILTANYKTKVNGFSILGLTMLNRNRKLLQKYGDSQYYVKYELRNYQLSLNMLLGGVFIDLVDPSLVRQFFEKTLEGCYIKAERFPFFGGIKALIGQGLLFSEGAQWKKKRRIMSSVFNYDFIKDKIPLIAAISQKVLDELERYPINDGKQEVKADVVDVLQKVFGNVVIKCFFGEIQLENIEGQSAFTFVNNLMEQNSKRLMTPLPFIFGSNFFKYNIRKIDRDIAHKIKIFDNYAQSTIHKHVRKLQNEEKKNQNKRKGIVDMLLKQNKLKNYGQTVKEKQHQDFYTQKDLVDEFKTFFMAGTDTTANNTTILIYQLAKYPEVQEKVRKEIEQVIGDDINNITFDDLKKLTYLQCVQKQTLRMYSPTAGIFSREATRDHFIGKIPIKKGMLVAVKIKPNHFKEQFYQNPQVYRPERWIDFDASKADSYAYFPFSSGQRNCIGQHLAMIQSKIIILSILKRYKTITLEKPEFRLYLRTLYGAEKMTTTFTKF